MINYNKILYLVTIIFLISGCNNVVKKDVDYCKEILPDHIYLIPVTNHIINSDPSINRFYALWLHVCKGFKRIDNANLWIEFFTINYNYLMPRGEKEEVKIEWKKVPKIINQELIIQKLKAMTF